MYLYYFTQRSNITHYTHRFLCSEWEASEILAAKTLNRNCWGLQSAGNAEANLQ